jgi:hypothetical protein
LLIKIDVVIHSATSRRRTIFYYEGEASMKTNVGSIDRVLRILLGLALIAATLQGAIGAWGWIGLVPLATGVFRFCPAYLPFGLRTCAVKK